MFEIIINPSGDDPRRHHIHEAQIAADAQNAVAPEYNAVREAALKHLTRVQQDIADEDRQPYMAALTRAQEQIADMFQQDILKRELAGIHDAALESDDFETAARCRAALEAVNCNPNRRLYRRRRLNHVLVSFGSTDAHIEE